MGIVSVLIISRGKYLSRNNNWKLLNWFTNTLFHSFAINGKHFYLKILNYEAMKKDW
jgi:hypothetical protein